MGTTVLTNPRGTTYRPPISSLIMEVRRSTRTRILTGRQLPSEQRILTIPTILGAERLRWAVQPGFRDLGPPVILRVIPQRITPLRNSMAPSQMLALGSVTSRLARRCTARRWI